MGFLRFLYYLFYSGPCLLTLVSIFIEIVLVIFPPRFPEVPIIFGAERFIIFNIDIRWSFSFNFV